MQYKTNTAFVSGNRNKKYLSVTRWTVHIIFLATKKVICLGRSAGDGASREDKLIKAVLCHCDTNSFFICMLGYAHVQKGQGL